MKEYIVWFNQINLNDVSRVGGKNASLGEMISRFSSAGIHVPGGFATTAHAYRDHLVTSGLKDRIEAALAQLDVSDVKQLAEVGATIREWLVNAPLTGDLEDAIEAAYLKLGNSAETPVAVRSSATAEDLPAASFAGQQETFLNVRGIAHVLTAVREVFASLFNDRAIAYRVHQGYDHSDVALSVGIQQMVRSDLGSSGVMFTLDTESGYDDVVFITASWGLGETIVQGAVNPDEFYVHKPTLRAQKPAILRRKIGSKASKMIYADDSATETTRVIETTTAERQHFSLSDAQIEELAQQAIRIEQHYGRPMDIEWGLDGETQELWILQARPETVKSRVTQQSLERYLSLIHI